MPNPRQTARSLFDRAVSAAEPAAAVRKAILNHPLPAIITGRLFIIAVGKAACAMIEEALKHAPNHVTTTAIAVTNYENARPVQDCKVLAAGHPIPDENGQKAARRVMSLLSNTGPADFVLALISGGGSAILPSPIDEITLKDKINTNAFLIKNGYDIGEINLIRQQLSILKGGGLARLANPASLRALIISDVVGDDLRVIASGPTAEQIGTASQAVSLLRSRGHFKSLPRAVRNYLNAPSCRPKRDPNEVQNQIISSNRQSLDAMLLAATNRKAKLVSDRLEGNVTKAAEKIATFIKNNPSEAEQVFIWGGETTVNVTGTGLGGRNQELALRVANHLQSLPDNWAFLSGGTDGRDGPTDAAGGLVDRGTIQRIETAGGDISQLLSNNDSHQALTLAEDLLITGATGTNVADVQVFVRQRLD